MICFADIRRFVRASLPVLLLTALSSCSLLRAPTPPDAVDVPPPMVPSATDPRVELLWDSYGVPHIFADDAAALFYAFGWSQMRSHGDLVLRLFGQSRGRAAEYWGDRFLESDLWVHTNSIPARAALWADAQPPHMSAYFEAFVMGMNEFARQNPAAIGEAWLQVLPLEVADIFAHLQRVLHFTFMASPQMVPAVQRQLQAVPGSNAWAIAPARSASRNALLLANPHLPWGDLFTFYEAHMVGPGFNVSGATFIGFPMLAIAFNEHLGWTHTVNTIDSADLYRIEVAGGTYMFDGEPRAFEVEDRIILVRQPDNTLAEVPLTVKRSVHGPVIAEGDGRAVALRVAGLDRPYLLEQYWDMMRAANRDQFEAALSRLQLPMFTVMYADRDGHIMHVFNGAVPERPRGGWDYWQGIVAGDSSATLWTRVHPYYSLPRVVNPASGWLQNANDPPWTTTIPFALDPNRFPAYMAPQQPMSFRAQRSARMLAEDSRITFDELVAYKNDTRMEAADHVVQDVIAAARSVGDEDARAAADVLERWDRTSDADSRGAVLFRAFHSALQRERWPGGSPWEVGWTASAPLATPDGLSDPRLAAQVLSRAAQSTRALHGSLDIAWGDVYRLRRDDVDLPASGGHDEHGVFRALGFTRLAEDSTRFTATSGDSYIAAVEFSAPIRAMTLLTYGNASQPGSPHRTDQLQLYARKEMKPVWLTREEVEANTILREAF
jgi:acyl-homoserine-lactone acylase